MHTPPGLKLLARLGVACPVLGATSAQVTELREMGLARLRGATMAPARPALGPALDRTTEAQARAWAQARGIGCEAVSQGWQHLRCRGFDAARVGVAGPPVSEMWLSFGPQGTLVAVDLYRRGLAPADEALAWRDATGRLQAVLGRPARAWGDAAPQALQAQTLAAAGVQYRYADYIASVTASEIPRSGLAVREQYLSAVAVPAARAGR
ncbi:MAG: hypothetical protein KGJ24_13910 [Burkholderiales bacterium]|nr:hypothetical protein [Burkholderiales bacterium]